MAVGDKFNGLVNIDGQSWNVLANILSKGRENLFDEFSTKQCVFTGGDGVVGETAFGGGVWDGLSFDEFFCLEQLSSKQKLNFMHASLKQLLLLSLTPLMSANPLMPKVSAKDSKAEICSSNTFTSPEYMNVNSATIDPNVAPGMTITGWNGGSKVRNSSEKNELQALNTTRCARTVRPSADSVTSVRWDWSKRSGNDVKRLV